MTHRTISSNDPMSDKYPSISPYNYCANNPVILVDPDGREVFLLGDYASLAYDYLVNTNPNITYTLDEETGQINGTANGQLTPNEQLLMDAMNPGTTVEQPMLKSEKQYQRNIRENQNIQRQQQMNNQIFGPRKF